MKKVLSLLLVAAMLAAMLAGCGSKQFTADADETTLAAENAEEISGEVEFLDEFDMGLVDIEDEAVALADAPVAAVPTYLTCEASGTLTKKAAKATIDYSNTKDGYVMVQYTASTNLKLKVQVKGPTTTYTYNITPQKWISFPFSDGNGDYTVAVYENVSGTKYANVVSQKMTVAMTDEFAPFVRPNQYVDYASAPNTVAKAKELCKDCTTALDKVAAVYQFVVKNFTYDKELAASVQSGYLPVLDTVLEKKKGICFDYAATMTGMLRSQGVPCKLVIGYAGSAYHAWISVYSEGEGWVNSAIYFNGTSWQRMDPTFASSSKESADVLKYIGDGNNYTAKYFY